MPKSNSTEQISGCTACMGLLFSTEKISAHHGETLCTLSMLKSNSTERDFGSENAEVTLQQELLFRHELCAPWLRVGQRHISVGVTLQHRKSHASQRKVVHCIYTEE
jgi:hypothetical protein